MTIQVAVSGAAGKMGREVVRAVADDAGLLLVGGVDPTHLGEDCGAVAGIGNLGKPIVSSLAGLPTRPDVLVDFTHPAAVLANARAALQAGIRPVIGTTGLLPEHLAELAALCQREAIGALVAPNFALGAVLLMRFAAEAARYFGAAEILELHHDQKADAPSGTALKTAQLMRAERDRFGSGTTPEREILPGARGADYQESGLRIHSIRLPGLVAHQEVVFGGLGQTLSLRHDSLSRESFMPGVLLGIREVIKRTELIYGLENLL
ncbi:MAG: 4-hydroxy-tetrahydrodipicolinate reductase [Cyanobacteria bacterium REEB65]|nr:4-hydroxy-tetrahydrodipicolinate reductase [Cyanobacteria bacterium REEB65]